MFPIENHRKRQNRNLIDTSNTQIHDRLFLSWLGTGTVIQSGGVKLVVLWVQTSLLSEAM